MQSDREQMPAMDTQTRAASSGTAALQPTDVLKTMDIDRLACCARAQHERFRQAQPEDTRFAHEIFRRALVEQDQLAWEYVYTLYRQLVMCWVQRSRAFARSDETSEYFANAAFLRLARAVTPATFANYPTVSALLQYLQRCARSVVIDHMRAAASKPIVVQHPAPLDRAGQARPDEQAIARISALETWRCIRALVHSEAEHEVLYRSIVLGMLPGEIYAERRDLFASVRAVYLAKRNVLQRLRHNRALQRLNQ